MKGIGYSVFYAKYVRGHVEDLRTVGLLTITIHIKSPELENVYFTNVSQYVCKNVSLQE